MTMNSSSLEDTNTAACLIIGPWLMITRGVLVAPLSVLVPVLTWRRRRPAAMTHTDVIMVHQAAAEFFWPPATVLNVWGEVLGQRSVLLASHCLAGLTLYGQSLFHVLAGVERYLAVLHPITYRRLRRQRGARLRDVSVGCVWLLSAALTSVEALPLTHSTLILNLMLIAAICAAMSFLTLSVLRLLIRRGPARTGGDVADVRKQRALSSVMVIFGLLWVWYVGYVAGTALLGAQLLNKVLRCDLTEYLYVFNLPCSVLLPLLHLHRAGHLKWCQACNRG